MYSRIFWLSCVVLICLFVSAVATEAAARQWELPEGADIDPLSLAVSPDHRYVLFVEPGVASKGTSESIRKLFPAAYWMLNTKSGKFSNLMELLPVPEGKGKLLVKPCGISANSQYSLVLAERIKQSKAKEQRKKGYMAFLVRLADGSVEQIGEEVVHAAWVGNRIALNHLRRKSEEADAEAETSADSEADEDAEDDGKKKKKRKLGLVKVVSNRRTQRMTLYDPEARSTTRLESRGIIIGGHPDGILLVFGCKVKDPTKPTGIDVLRGAKMAVINFEGEILRSLDIKPLSGYAPSRPILSSKGKFVAFREGRLARGRKPKKVEIQVIATTGEEERTIEEVGTPIGLIDDGRVIIVGNVFNADGAAVQVWDEELNSQTVLENVGAAALAGNQLFYLTTGENPAIRSIRLGL